MNSPRFSRISGVACLLALFQFTAPFVSACGISSSAAYSSETYVEAERAIIIWDESHHMEHFIRQASIRTRTPDLGFLVPTPEPPEMVEVDPRIFDMATEIGKPDLTPPTVPVRPMSVFIPFSFDFSAFFYYDRWKQNREANTALASARSATAKATVVSEGDVGGYHATVFAAGNYTAIAGWLGTNGYSLTPEMTAWLKTYTAKKWTITAFQLSKSATPNDSGRMTSRAIRLSFHTDKPFYPYSEPGDRQRASAASPLGRALRLTVLSDQRLTGTLSDKSLWPGRLEFAGSTTPAGSTKGDWKANQWLEFAGLDTSDGFTLPKKMTSFLDESNPRPGTSDLFFTPDADSGSFRAVRTDYSLPPERRFDLTHPWNNLAGLMFLIFVPGAPFYCGWRMRQQNCMKSTPSNVTRKKSRWSRAPDLLLGNAAILVGIVASFPFGVFFIAGLGEVIVLPFTGEMPFEGLLTVAFCLPLLIISLGAVHCGCKLCHGRRLLPRLETESRLLTFISRWEKVMVMSSLLVGVLALVGVLFLVITNVPA